MNNQSSSFIPTERDAEHTIRLLRDKKRYLEERLHESEAMYHTLLGMYMKLRHALVGDVDDDMNTCRKSIGGMVSGIKSNVR